MQYLHKNMPGAQQMCLIYAAVGPCDELRRDLIDASVCEALLGAGEPILTEAEFQRRSAAADASLIGISNALCAWVGAALQSYQQYRDAAERRGAGVPPPAGADIEEQLRHLVYRGFVAATPYHAMRHYPRYLKAIERRLQRLRQNPASGPAIAGAIRAALGGLARSRRRAAVRPALVTRTAGDWRNCGCRCLRRSWALQKEFRSNGSTRSSGAWAEDAKAQLKACFCPVLRAPMLKWAMSRTEPGGFRERSPWQTPVTVQQCVEALCQSGCDAVRATIHALERGLPVAQTDTMTDQERNCCALRIESDHGGLRCA